MILEYYNYDELSTRIEIDYRKNKIRVKNYTDDLVARAFGVNDNPTLSVMRRFQKADVFLNQGIKLS